MYNFKLENFSNSSSSVSKIISQFKLVITWNQDFDDISTTITLIIILFYQKFNLEKFVVFWFQLAPALMAVGLEWNQKFKIFWFHFGSIGSILVPFWFHWFHFGIQYTKMPPLMLSQVAIWILRLGMAELIISFVIHN